MTFHCKNKRISSLEIFASKNLLSPYSLKIDKFLMSSYKQGWRTSSRMSLERCFTRMLYSNLNYKDDIIIYEVQKHPISLIVEESVETCDLPYIDSLYKQEEIDVGEKFNYVNIDLSFLSNLTNGIHIPFSADYRTICPYILTHSMKQHISSSKGNTILGKHSKLIWF